MATSATTADSLDAPASALRAEYRLFGQAPRGGPYNSHLVSGVVIMAVGAAGVIHPWLAGWIGVCLVAALLLDRRSWRRKVAPSAIPGQLWLYLQLFAHATWDALPQFVFAYVIYVCVAPVVLTFNVAVSSFVMLYGFYMLIRGWCVLRYLWVLGFHWEQAGRTFEVHHANLRSRSSAIRHVLWAYFLGNVGLVVRCGSQVITIAGFEYLRQRLGMDLSRHPIASEHLTPICAAATIVWLAAFWWSIQRVLLVYYRTHRTLHTCRPLYDSIHAIHHRGVLPTPLDSGTISPAEFAITEMAIPAAMLVPNWWWTLCQVVLAFAGHLPSHNAGTRWTFPQHHLGHHRLFNLNFGLTPAEDQRYGTLWEDPAEESRSSDQSPVPSPIGSGGAARTKVKN